MTEADWLVDYLATLPTNIRPRADDPRFIAAASTAYRNGWTGRNAAHTITKRSYANATNPTLIAIMELERIAESAPTNQPTHRRTKRHDCIACPPSASYTDDQGIRRAGCPNPVTEPTPLSWVAERMLLLVELSNTKDLDEDAREAMMTSLIAEQHARN